MVEQTPANLGRRRRRAADQHRLADPRFQQFDALGDRRLRQAQTCAARSNPACSTTAARAESNL
jgi:hypothetical protein